MFLYFHSFITYYAYRRVEFKEKFWPHKKERRKGGKKDGMEGSKGVIVSAEWKCKHSVGFESTSPNSLMCDRGPSFFPFLHSTSFKDYFI